MSDKTAPAKATGARGRSGGDWNKTKEVPKRRRGKQQVSDSEEEEEQEEEEEAEEEEEEEEGADDASETGSDSDHAPRKKLVTRKAAAQKAKETTKKDKEPTPNARRRRAPMTAIESDEGSATTSPNATDDEMNGRNSEAVKAEPSAPTTSSTAAPVTEKNPTPPAADRERERERDDDRYRERERDRDADRDRERSRNSSMTLPSLSRAAMMHMNNRDDASMNGGTADTSNRSWRRDRSRSRSRERDAGDNNANRWNESSNNNAPKDNGRGSGDENMSSYSGDGGRGNDDPSSPNHDGQDVRIMFHGREIYADDLIGLRVAKTFVGHGRFLGQVVKFDEPTSLYTIVYADGDAEELSIEHTIQILIQDEIERADPSVPPLPMAFRNDRIPDSPDAGSVTPSSTTTVSVPVAPMNASNVSTPQPPPPQAPPSSQPPVYPSRRSTMSFTDREAQFVMGMFENNALPVLLRQGWRVQHDDATRERRFYAPMGTFRGAGHVFLSAFDVVELIVFDNELLSACFPQNMHSVILSLFPDSASRKRGSPAVQTDGPKDGYDSKRVRGGGREYASGPAAGVAPLVRPGPGPGGAGGPMGMPPSRSDDRLVPPMAYRPDDRDRMDRVDRERERDGYGGPQRIAPLGANDRFPSNNAPPPMRGTPPESGYRRSGSEDYRAMPLRAMADSAPGAPPPSARWGNSGGAPSNAPDASEYHHRRSYSDAPEWNDRDGMRGPPPPSSGGGYSRPSSGGAHRGEEPNRGVYYDRGVPRGGGGGGGPSMGRPGPGGPGNEPMSSSYGRYREPTRGPPGQYSPESFSNRYPPSQGPDYRGPSPGGPPPSSFARSGSRDGPPSGPGGPSGGRGFSMMDVDRNATTSSSGYDHRMDRGRSPHLSNDVGGPPPGSYGGPHGAHYGHHQRSGSNGSGPNPAD